MLRRHLAYLNESLFSNFTPRWWAINLVVVFVVLVKPEKETLPPFVMSPPSFLLLSLLLLLRYVDIWRGNFLLREMSVATATTEFP